MRAVPVAILSMGVGACSLIVNLDGLTAGDASVESGADTSTPDASSDVDVLDAPLVVSQHQVCTDVADVASSGCKFQAALSPGDSIIVHFYFNYFVSQIAVATVTDDDSNAYTFLDVGDVACPGGKLSNQVCCTNAGGSGTCQGWAIATSPALAASNPPTVTVTMSTPSNIGINLLEVSGLGGASLDQSASGAVPIDAASVVVPTIVTGAPGDLVLAGISIYVPATAALSPAAGWMYNEDPGYYAATLFQTAGAAGSTYGGDLGAFTPPSPYGGTGTVLALKR